MSNVRYKKNNNNLKPKKAFLPEGQKLKKKKVLTNLLIFYFPYFLIKLIF